MKNLFLLTILLSFVGASNVDKTDAVYSFFYKYAPEITVLTILASAYLIKYLWEKRIDMRLIIHLNILIIRMCFLLNIISKYRLKKRVKRTKKKLSKIDNANSEIREIARDNIALWKEQIKLNEKTTDFYRSKKSSLVQCKNDLRLLAYLVKQARREPNAEKKIYQLEASINKVSKNISNRLIEQLETQKRKDNIIQFSDRIAKVG